MPKGIPNKRYTPEFKQLVVETMHRDKLSIREVSAQFENGGYSLTVVASDNGSYNTEDML